MKNQRYSLTSAFSDSIIGNIIDPSLDLIEIPIDDLFEEGLIKEIPIAKTIYAIGKTFVSLREKYLYKKVVTFIQEFNRDALSEKAIQDHIYSLSDEKKYMAECEQVLLYIDSCNQPLHAKYLSHFHRAYINKEISWDVFQELADINQRMFIGDYKFIQLIMIDNLVVRINEDNASSIQRLSSMGLLSDFMPIGLSDFGIATKPISGNHLIITPLGKLLGRYIDDIDRSSITSIGDSINKPKY